MQNFSFQKLFKFWLPLLSIISVIISLVYIFTVKDSQYLSSTFSVGGLWSTFWYAMENASEGFIVTIFLCSVAHVLFIEIFLLIRLFKLKKIEQSGWRKAFIRFLGVQLIGSGFFISIFIFIFFISFGFAFVFGYTDMFLHKKEALIGVISDNEEIIRKIQSASEIIDVYDASGEFGVVLAKRGLKKEEKLNAYNALVLPLLVKLVGRDKEGRTFYISETNSVVYTDFSENETDQVIIELAFNHLRNSTNPLIVSAFKNLKQPTVSYLTDEKYVPFLKKKQVEINADIVNDFQKIISLNENILAECKIIDEKNLKLVNSQEDDYQKNCVLSKRYSDCTEFAQKINENKNISRESANTCQENKKVLYSQYDEMINLKANVEKDTLSILEDQKKELSNGMYFLDIKNIYMRIVPGQDSFVYLSTLLHELFHHYSNSGSQLPVFVNEGITDLLTLKSFNLSDYEIARRSGYFKEVQVVMALLEKIPEEDLMMVYFNNDVLMFEKLFKKYFPEVDYAMFLTKGDVLFKETYNVITPFSENSFWLGEVDHSSVRDMRIFLGLEKTKFLEF